MADRLTVIIVALLGDDALASCVAAMRSQAATILVVDRDGGIFDGEMRPVGRASALNVPAKRRSAVELASTPLVALIEDIVAPDPGWADAAAAALSRTGVVACGGPVRIPDTLPASTRALALAEYARFNDRSAEATVQTLPGCNFAFRRQALLDAMEGSDGLVDQDVFRRLNRPGQRLAWAPEMGVTFARAFDEGASLKTRFQHGRIYGSSEASRGGFPGRAMTVAKGLALPAVLTMRTLASATPRQRRSVSTVAWLLLQHAAWAAGEIAGAVMGASRKGLGEWR